MRVALFVTCLADLFRPSVAFAAVKLLRDAGCGVEVPRAQTCCGQPAYNNGDRASARAIARQVIAAFELYEAVVVPSGSCAGMLRHHYPALFADVPAWRDRAEALAERVHELTSFLTDVLGVERVEAGYEGRVTYHDSCSSLREMAVRAQPRRLLASVKGLELAELPDSRACCGFGGTFCVKFPEISARMVDDKISAVEATGANTLLAGDLGCLLNIAGRMGRRGSRVRVFHVAEVLAGTAEGPGIGGSGE
ncbi:MAG: (Fe-S)-binding protein [Chromatiales bacterium]|jgi:L-lactate dehydrogenase complex protein LldE